MKKIITIIVAITMISVAGINFKLNNSTGNKIHVDLKLSNTEGLACDLCEWWDRPDYNCEKVLCWFIFPWTTYESLEAVFVGEGLGSVAHTWNCAGC